MIICMLYQLCYIMYPVKFMNEIIQRMMSRMAIGNECPFMIVVFILFHCIVSERVHLLIKDQQTRPS